jgi:rod shape-determining protein MreC
MPLGTIDRAALPLFNQGPSAFSKLIFFSVLALFLMVADARFNLVQPVRTTISAVLYPIQWLALKPVQFVVASRRHFEDLQIAQAREAEARKALAAQSERANQADVLERENVRLRAMLELRQVTQAPGRVVEVLYGMADPYTRKLVIDQGMAQGIVPGSPVIDENGVLGQVTQVQVLTSEITLVIDRDLSIPVQNMRTGVRGVAFGDASARGGGLELRFMAPDSDIQEGDILSTSGVDGIYPPGLPVAKVDRVDRRADSAFARVHCVPLGHVTSARYALVLAPRKESSPAASGPASLASVANPGAAALVTNPAVAKKIDKKVDKKEKGKHTP